MAPDAGPDADYSFAQNLIKSPIYSARKNTSNTLFRSIDNDSDIQSALILFTIRCDLSSQSPYVLVQLIHTRTQSESVQGKEANEKKKNDNKRLHSFSVSR